MTDYDAALRAARERVIEGVVTARWQLIDYDECCGDDIKMSHDGQALLSAALDAYEALAKAVGAAAMPCSEPWKKHWDELQADPARRGVIGIPLVRLNCGSCESCKARAVADRLAAPFLSEVKA